MDGMNDREAGEERASRTVNVPKMGAENLSHYAQHDGMRACKY
jgi:hypothetical protein